MSKDLLGFGLAANNPFLCDCVDPFGIEDLYYIDPATYQYRSIRTTSQVENLHRGFSALLQGCVLPGLADALIMEFAAQNNMGQAARAGSGHRLPNNMDDLDLAVFCVLKGLVNPFLCGCGGGGPAAASGQLAAAGPVESFGLRMARATGCCRRLRCN